MSSNQRKEWSKFARDNNYGSESNHPRVEISLRKIKKEHYNAWENIKANYQIDNSIDSIINRFIINHVIKSNGKRLHDCLRLANDLAMDIHQLNVNVNSKDEDTTNLEVGDIVFVKNSDSEFTKAIISRIEDIKYNEAEVAGSVILRRFQTTKQVNYYVKYEQKPGSDEYGENEFIAKWESIHRNINQYYQWFKMIEIMIVFVDKYVINNYLNDITFVTDEYQHRLRTLNDNIRAGVTSKYNSLSFNSFTKNLTKRVDNLNDKCNAHITHLRRRSNHWWFRLWKNYNIEIDYYQTFKNNTLHSFKEEVEETTEKYVCLKDYLNSLRKYMLRIKESVDFNDQGYVVDAKTATVKFGNIIKLVTHVHTRILGDYNIT